MGKPSVPPVSLVETLHPAIVRPIAGRAAHGDLYTFLKLDLDRLVADMRHAIAGWDWSRGRYGHSLPLTFRRLSASGREHGNNWVLPEGHGSPEPPAERLDGCPYLEELFEAFSCEIVSFRLLRRAPGTSYTLHADIDLSPEIKRFQIPIVTNDQAFLMVSSATQLEEFTVPDRRFCTTKDWAGEGVGRAQMESWYQMFVAANQDAIKIYQLPPGALYYFNTIYYHNMWNFGTTDRITLAIDLQANDWLRRHFRPIFPT